MTESNRTLGVGAKVWRWTLKCQ